MLETIKNGFGAIISFINMIVDLIADIAHYGAIFIKFVFTAIPLLLRSVQWLPSVCVVFGIIVAVVSICMVILHQKGGDD